MKYELTEQQVNTLINFIDIAVKSMGLRSADSAVILTRVLQNPLKEGGKAEGTDTEKDKK